MPGSPVTMHRPRAQLRDEPREHAHERSARGDAARHPAAVARARAARSRVLDRAARGRVAARARRAPRAAAPRSTTSGVSTTSSVTSAASGTDPSSAAAPLDVRVGVGEPTMRSRSHGVTRGTRRSFAIGASSPGKTRFTPSPSAVSMTRMSRTRCCRPVGSSDAAWSDAPHRAVERDVPLDGDRAERDGGERDLQAALVAGVADRHAGVAVAQRRDHAQVRLLGLHRVRRGRVHEHEPVGAEHLDRGVDLLDRRHAGREDDGLAGVAQRLEQLVVGERRRGDLVRDDVELLEELDARHVPRRREPLEPAQQRVVARSRCTRRGRTRRGGGSRGRSSCPTASRAARRACARASRSRACASGTSPRRAPASAATSMSCLAISTSPLWLRPISAMT